MGQERIADKIELQYFLVFDNLGHFDTPDGACALLLQRTREPSEVVLTLQHAGSLSHGRDIKPFTNDAGLLPH